MQWLEAGADYAQTQSLHAVDQSSLPKLQACLVKLVGDRSLPAHTASLPHSNCSSRADRP